MKAEKYDEEINWKVFSEQWEEDEEFRKYYEIDRLMASFTEALAEIMVDNGWKQQDLAKRLGVSNSYLGRLLKGKKNVSLKTIAKTLLKLDRRACLNVMKLENDFVPTNDHYVKAFEREYLFPLLPKREPEKAKKKEVFYAVSEMSTEFTVVKAEGRVA